MKKIVTLLLFILFILFSLSLHANQSNNLNLIKEQPGKVKLQVLKDGREIASGDELLNFLLSIHLNEFFETNKNIRFLDEFFKKYTPKFILEKLIEDTNNNPSKISLYKKNLRNHPFMIALFYHYKKTSRMNNSEFDHVKRLVSWVLDVSFNDPDFDYTLYDKLLLDNYSDIDDVIKALWEDKTCDFEIKQEIFNIFDFDLEFRSKEDFHSFLKLKEKIASLLPINFGLDYYNYISEIAKVVGRAPLNNINGESIDKINNFMRFVFGYNATGVPEKIDFNFPLANNLIFQSKLLKLFESRDDDFSKKSINAIYESLRPNVFVKLYKRKKDTLMVWLLDNLSEKNKKNFLNQIETSFNKKDVLNDHQYNIHLFKYFDMNNLIDVFSDKDLEKIFYSLVEVINSVNLELPYEVEMVETAADILFGTKLLGRYLQKEKNFNGEISLIAKKIKPQFLDFYKLQNMYNLAFNGPDQINLNHPLPEWLAISVYNITHTLSQFDDNNLKDISLDEIKQLIIFADSYKLTFMKKNINGYDNYEEMPSQYESLIGVNLAINDQIKLFEKMINLHKMLGVYIKLSNPEFIKNLLEKKIINEFLKSKIEMYIPPFKKALSHYLKNIPYEKIFTSKELALPFACFNWN